MKTMKKLLASLLLIAMLASLLTVGAMAANGTVQVTGGTVIGDVYNFYKIFELDEANYADGKPLFKESVEWAGLYLESGASTYYTLSDDGYVIKGTGWDTAGFISFVKENLTGKSVTETKTVSASNVAVTVSLEPGYYLMTVTSASTGNPERTPGILQVLPGKETKIEVKSTVLGLPQMVKEVSDNDVLPTWADSNDVAIGDEVHFQVTIKTEAAGQNYVFTDTLASGFDLVPTSITVKKDGSELATGTYNLTTTGNEINIAFAQTYLDTLKDNDEIIIKYTAILNEGAVIATTGNVNSAKLTYTGGDPRTDSTTTYTYQINLKKTDTEGNTIDGAEFTLSDGTDNILVVPVGDDYRVAKSGEAGATEKIEAGAVKIFGLDAGTYTFTETAAPKGYIKAATIESVKLSESAKIVDRTVVNIAGVEMPSTGGIGTTIFYCIGGLLVLAAAVVLVTRRRVVED